MRILKYKGTLFICLTWILAMLIFSDETLYFNSTLFMNGQIWRVITGLFTKGLLYETLLGMVMTVILGLLLEDKIGSFKFVSIYYGIGVTFHLLFWLMFWGREVNSYSGNIGSIALCATLLTLNNIESSKFRRNKMLSCVLLSGIVYFVIHQIITGGSIFFLEVAFVIGMIAALCLEIKKAKMSLCNKKEKSNWKLYKGTISIIGICAMVYIVNAVIYSASFGNGLRYFVLGSNQNGELYDLFLFSSATLKKFQIWRLFTNIYLHENLLHIGGNMLAIFFVGKYLEPKIGTVKFTSLYTVAGAGLTFYEYMQGGNISDLSGSSLSIYAMIAIYLVFVFNEKIEFHVGKFGFIFVIGYFFIANYDMFFYGDIMNHMTSYLIGLVMSTFIVKGYIANSKSCFHKKVIK